MTFIKKVIDNGLEWICILLLAVITVDLLLGVFSRYVLASTFVWYDEVARACFMWLVFIGAAVAVRKSAHFGLHIFVDIIAAAREAGRAAGDAADHHRLFTHPGLAWLGPDAAWRHANHRGHGHADLVDLCLDAGGRRVDGLLRVSHFDREAGQGDRFMIGLAILVFFVLLLLGVPVAFAIGAAGLAGLLWSGSFPLIVIMQQIHQSVDSFVLLAIPLFVFAGMLMETGGIAVRLVHLAQALIGWIRGGLAMAVVVAEYIFSGISGSTIADVSAIGATMIPPMTRAGYRPGQAVSIVSAASAMGILVPPCILMIVLGAIANVSVAALFVAGFIPAVVLALAIMGYIYYEARRDNIAPPQRMDIADIRKAIKQAIIPLGLPAIIFGGILGGVVTPTEAASLAVLYAFIVGVFVYREIKWSDLPAIMVRSAVVTATVCFLLAVAAVIAWMLAVAQVPQAILSAMQALSVGQISFLILNALLFILLGAVLEGLPAVVILVPTFLPVVKQMNIDLIHYSIVVTAATGIGLFLPPIGVGLFVACGVAGIGIDKVTREMMPYVLMLMVGLLFVIVFPWLTLVLPKLFGV